MSKNNSLWSRARISLIGLRETWRRERSFRLLALAAAAAAGLLAWVDAAPFEWAVAALAMSVALGMETMNAALEALADRMHPERHPEIGAAKDMASSAVFIANCVAGGLIVWIVWRNLA